VRPSTPLQLENARSTYARSEGGHDFCPPPLGLLGATGCAAGTPATFKYAGAAGSGNFRLPICGRITKPTSAACRAAAANLAAAAAAAAPIAVLPLADTALGLAFAGIGLPAGGLGPGSTCCSALAWAGPCHGGGCVGAEAAPCVPFAL